MLNDSRIKIRSNLKIFRGSPNVIAVIDVLFLLLLFFMISSSFVQVSGIKVDLPAISTQSPLGVEKYVITIDRQSKIFFNDQPLFTWDLLKEKLTEVSSKSKTGTVILRADNRTPFGIVAKLMALCEEAKLNVFVATVSPPKQKDVQFKDSGSDE
ncbi:MAG: hypothetical protein A2017_06055 [Lentisphaerae bacterium GWF2_44_16]|nr:MAG: hypothetical protein A2017_06055 [Lentisphaerae bacterium GWF2_44_16]